MLSKFSLFLTLPMAIVIGLTGCASTASTKGPQNQPKPSVSSAADSAKPKLEKIVEVVTTKENPAPAGTVFYVKDKAGKPMYKVAIGTIDFDGKAELTAINSVITVLNSGYHYLIVPVEVTFLGSTLVGVGSARDVYMGLEAADNTRTETAGLVEIPGEPESNKILKIGETGHRNWVFVSSDAFLDKELIRIGSGTETPHFVRLK